MAVYLQSRLDFLQRVQNSDGGWGYFPGKQSWLEPTAYAMLALHGTSQSQAALEQAWKCVQTWQKPDGSFRPSTQIQDGTWVTALALLVACCRGTLDRSANQGVAWLLGTRGAESRWTFRAASYFHVLKTDVNVTHPGWPWRPGTSAWVEPTALTVLALKRTLALRRDPQVSERIGEGEDMLYSRRGHDGGWNCGNSSVLKFDLPSYPESTALALLGLQGRPARELAGPLETARGFYRESKSPLANAWLQLAFRCYGQPAAAPAAAPAPPRDVMLCALQALGDSGGNHRLLTVGGAA